MIVPNYIFVVSALALSGLSVASPYMLGQAIDSFHTNSRLALSLVGLASFCIVVSPCLKVMINIYLCKVNRDTKLRVKRHLLIMLCLHNFHRLKTGGELIDLVDGDVDGALYLYHRVYFDVAFNIGLILMSLVAVAYYVPLLSVAPVIAIVLSASICWLMRSSANGAFRNYVESNTELLGKVCDEVRNDSVICRAEYEGQSRRIERQAFVASFRSAGLSALGSSGYFVGLAALFFIAGELLADGSMTVGSVFSAVIYIERIITPVAAMVAVYYSTREGAVRLTRIKNNSMISPHA